MHSVARVHTPKEKLVACVHNILNSVPIGTSCIKKSITILPALIRAKEIGLLSDLCFPSMLLMSTVCCPNLHVINSTD